MTAFEIFAFVASSIAILQIALITIYILVRIRRRRNNLALRQSNNGENEHNDNIRFQVSPSNGGTAAMTTLSVSQFVSPPPPPYQTCQQHSLPVIATKNDLSDLPTYNQAIISDSDFHFSSKS